VDEPRGSIWQSKGRCKSYHVEIALAGGVSVYGSLMTAIEQTLSNRFQGDSVERAALLSCGTPAGLSRRLSDMTRYMETAPLCYVD
jgi:hypothetical protein